MPTPASPSTGCLFTLGSLECCVRLVSPANFEPLHCCAFRPTCYHVSVFFFFFASFFFFLLFCVGDSLGSVWRAICQRVSTVRDVCSGISAVFEKCSGSDSSRVSLARLTRCTRSRVERCHSVLVVLVRPLWSAQRVARIARGPTLGLLVSGA